MSKSKRNHKPKSRSRKKQQAEEPSFFEYWSTRLREMGASSSRIASAVVLGGLMIGWFVAEAPLVNRVAAMSTDPLTIRFTWPVHPADAIRPADQRRTWLHPTIQQDLTQTAALALSMNPFDQQSLEDARAALLATGWLRDVTEIRRKPAGIIDISCVWRAPAAIVEHNGAPYLVAAQGEVLRTPLNADFGQQDLFRIINPSTGAPRDAQGRVAFGIPWQYGEIQPAIELLVKVAGLEHAKRIVAVDLKGFGVTNKLALITDSGCRIVWGAPPSEIAPQQASTEERLTRLEAILRDKLDRDVRELDLYHHRGAIIDKTNALR